MNNFSRTMVLQGAENIETVSYNSKMHHQFPDADSTTCTQEPENTFGLETFRDDLCFRLGEHKGNNSTFFFLHPSPLLLLEGNRAYYYFSFKYNFFLYIYIYMNK